MISEQVIVHVGKHQGVKTPNLETGKKWSAALGSGVKAGEARKQKWSIEAYIGSAEFYKCGKTPCHEVLLSVGR